MNIEPSAAAGGDLFINAKTQRRGVNPTTDSQEGGFTPVLPTTETSGGKSAFPTATGKVDPNAPPFPFASQTDQENYAQETTNQCFAFRM